MTIDRSSVMRIDKELEKEIREVSKKNDMGLREASKEIARLCKMKKGNKLTKEIKF